MAPIPLNDQTHVMRRRMRDTYKKPFNYRRFTETSTETTEPCPYSLTIHNSEQLFNEQTQITSLTRQGLEKLGGTTNYGCQDRTSNARQRSH